MSGLKTAALLGALSGLFIVVGGLLGGQSGLIMAFGIALVMNIGSYWFSDTIVLRMYKAREVGAGHRLFDTTARLARRAELPMPRVYVIPDMSPNAFATGRNPQHAAVAATEGILRLLSDSELEGVMAHELAHVRNRDILISSVAATIGAAITMLVHMAQALRRLEAGVKQIPMDANQATAHMFIVSPLHGGGLSSLFSTHPSTQARVDALMRLQLGA
ncbi:MAG: M48 family metalloprotease [Acidobacteria bacterium]|nr:M48 family metalloprotease [Acidobacteriota bacterium]